MNDCQKMLRQQLPLIRETITQTTTDWRERAFGFSDTKQTSIYLGDCDEVEKPDMHGMIGSFHTHTIEYSRPSEDDFNAFQQSNDKLLCYAVPKDEIWSVKCFDRDLATCADDELRLHDR